MRLALVGQGYWGSKVSAECREIGIETDIFEIDNDLSVISPTDYFGCVIATPAEDHVGTAIKLLKNKNNLLIEKPIAMNMRELDLLNDHVTQEKIMVGHILLYNEIYHEAKKEIDNLQHIHTRRNAWGRLKTNITPILNLAPHDVALLDDIFGRKPTTVYSHGVSISKQAQPDTVYCFLDYGPVTVTLELGWYNHCKIRETNFVCDKKHIIWDDVAKGLCVKDLYLNGEGRQTEGKIQNLPIKEKNSPLVNQLKAFQNYCVENITPITNLKHARRVTEVVDALDKSLREKREICL